MQIAAGTIGAAQVNTAEVQARVAGACASGYIAAFNANGSVICVPDGAGSFKRVNVSGSVPATATSFETAANVATLTFTANTTGTAVVSGSGYCNQVSLTTSGTNVVLQAAPSTDSGLNVSAVAVYSLLQEASSQNHQWTWSLQRDLPVTQGMSYPVFIKGGMNLAPLRSRTATEALPSASTPARCRETAHLTEVALVVETPSPSATHPRWRSDLAPGSCT